WCSPTTGSPCTRREILCPPSFRAASQTFLQCCRFLGLSSFAKKLGQGAHVVQSLRMLGAVGPFVHGYRSPEVPFRAGKVSFFSQDMTENRRGDRYARVIVPEGLFENQEGYVYHQQLSHHSIHIQHN